ncbi:RNA-dependent RNA polymerase [Erysiphe necator associated narnavirus 27]|nr:RNA-dependent RNA polymerase [Erysiphe necator associated narnavirus 27]
MVFQHCCIPLNVKLRGVTQPGRKLNSDKEFTELLEGIRLSLVEGKAPSDAFVWDYEYENMFTSRPGGRPLHKHRSDIIVDILAKRTYWYKRLASYNKLLVKTLVKSNKLLHLKEILHVADGFICQLLVSFPEVILNESVKPYDYTDLVSNSIISNCLQNYALVLKTLKKFKKLFRKQAFLRERFEWDGKYRQFSWLKPIVDFYNKNLASSNSRAKMFRVIAFTQSRSTGLADKKMMDETIQEFLDAVTVKKEFKPDSLLLETIEEVTTELVNNAMGVSANFRTSMSTSACKENSKKKEGKFGHLKKRIRENTFPAPPSFSPFNEGGEIGTPLWREAFERAERGDEDLWKVNVAAIRENGKCRIVTSGSFYKDALLQPFSHLTIEMAKCNETLAESFQAARLGYQFVLGIDSLDAKRGEIIFEDELSAQCFDFEKATDRPTHESGRALMGPLLLKTGLTEHQVKVILDVWVGDKILYSGKKVIGKMVNGIPMGDPLTKTNLSLVHVVSSRYAKKKLGKRIVTLGTGNGDDGVQIAAGPLRFEYFKHFLHCAAMLGYEKSEDDTFITEDWMVYCEEVFRIPIDRFHTVRNANRLKDQSISPYLDVPKGRLIVDTKKDRADFSSDPKGKYTLMGKDLEYVKKDGGEGINFLFAVSSACQDICLGLKDRREPVFLPRQIFGIGKMVPMWNHVAWTNAIMSQKPWCRNVCLRVIREYLGVVKPILSEFRGVMSSQPHFDKESSVEIMKIPEDSPLNAFKVVQRDDWDKFPLGSLEKLAYSGKLVRETEISKHYLFQTRLASLEQDQNADLFETIRTMSIELKEYTREETLLWTRKFCDIFENAPWRLKYIKREDLFDSSVIQLLAKTNPLRVDLGESYTYPARFCKPPKPDTPYQRDVENLMVWFNDNYEDILAGNSYELPPTNIIEDDPILLLKAEASESDMVILVSDDWKLARLMANKVVAKLIGQISIRNWLAYSASEETFQNLLREVLPNVSVEFLVDQGSIETFLDNHPYTGDGKDLLRLLDDSIVLPDQLKRTWTEDLHRTPIVPNPYYGKKTIRPVLRKENLFSVVKLATNRGLPSWKRWVQRVTTS